LIKTDKIIPPLVATENIKICQYWYMREKSWAF